METLPVKTLDELFSNPATCLAVFRFPPYPPSPPPPPPSPTSLLPAFPAVPLLIASRFATFRFPIFRSLPELAKMFIFRLLYIDTNKMEIPVALITTSWCLPTAKE